MRSCYVFIYLGFTVALCIFFTYFIFFTGGTLFPETGSPLKRAALGGLTFVLIKGGLKIYHKQHLYIRQCKRIVLDYSQIIYIYLSLVYNFQPITCNGCIKYIKLLKVFFFNTKGEICKMLVFIFQNDPEPKFLTYYNQAALIDSAEFCDCP